MQATATFTFFTFFANIFLIVVSGLNLLCRLKPSRIAQQFQTTVLVTHYHAIGISLHTISGTYMDDVKSWCMHF